jgi:hypothetical protein
MSIMMSSPVLILMQGRSKLARGGLKPGVLKGTASPKRVAQLTTEFKP